MSAIATGHVVIAPLLALVGARPSQQEEHLGQRQMAHQLQCAVVPRGRSPRQRSPPRSPSWHRSWLTSSSTDRAAGSMRFGPGPWRRLAAPCSERRCPRRSSACGVRYLSVTGSGLLPPALRVGPCGRVVLPGCWVTQHLASLSVAAQQPVSTSTVDSRTHGRGWPATPRPHAAARPASSRADRGAPPPGRPGPRNSALGRSGAGRTS